MVSFIRTKFQVLTEQIFELSHASDLTSIQKPKKAIYEPTYFKNFQILIKMSSSVMTKIHAMVYKSCIFGQTRVCICILFKFVALVKNAWTDTAIS